MLIRLHLFAGIGFKATAVVSEVTYINSAGFSFVFDMRPAAYSVPHLGLVCPRWEEGLTCRMSGWIRERLAGAAGPAGCLLCLEVLLGTA